MRLLVLRIFKTTQKNLCDLVWNCHLSFDYFVKTGLVFGYPTKKDIFLALTFSVNYPNLQTQKKLCGNKILGRTAKLIKLFFSDLSLNFLLIFSLIFVLSIVIVSPGSFLTASLLYFFKSQTHSVSAQKQLSVPFF